MLTSYIPFTVTLSGGQIIPMRDIFAFRNTLSSVYLETALRYTIKSGDTPTSLAYFLYSSDRYEWIIYCMNSIVNPYYDWPLAEDDFYEMIASKYFGKSCFFLELDSVTTNFTKGATITNGTATAIVTGWDRTLSRLTVEDVVGVFEVEDDIGTGIIGRIVERSEDAVHHFETSAGVQLDPYIGYIHAYISGVNEVYAYTNKQFEEKVNDSKRQIYIIPPGYAREAENLLIRNINKLATYDAENILL